MAKMPQQDQTKEYALDDIVRVLAQHPVPTLINTSPPYIELPHTHVLHNLRAPPSVDKIRHVAHAPAHLEERGQLGHETTFSTEAEFQGNLKSSTTCAGAACILLDVIDETEEDTVHLIGTGDSRFKSIKTVERVFGSWTHGA